MRKMLRPSLATYMASQSIPAATKRDAGLGVKPVRSFQPPPPGLEKQTSSRTVKKFHQTWLRLVRLLGLSTFKDRLARTFEGCPGRLVGNSYVGIFRVAHYSECNGCPPGSSFLCKRYVGVRTGFLCLIRISPGFNVASSTYVNLHDNAATWNGRIRLVTTLFPNWGHARLFKVMAGIF
jgi:hypothetical protein